jgi:hypothetical protein
MGIDPFIAVRMAAVKIGLDFSSTKPAKLKRYLVEKPLYKEALRAFVGLCVGYGSKRLQ